MKRTLLDERLTIDTQSSNTGYSGNRNIVCSRLSTGSWTQGNTSIHTYTHVQEHNHKQDDGVHRCHYKQA